MVRSAQALRRYGWVIFALSLGNLLVEGGTKSSEAIFYHVLLDAFGRSATFTSSLFSVAGLVGALSAPLLGFLLARWGAQTLFPLAGLFILIGWLVSSFAPDLPQMLIFYGVFAGIGHTAISSFSMTATLAPWFPQTRGLMLGMADSGNPLGQAIFAPAAELLTSAWGWRWAFRCYGLIFFTLIALPNGLLQRRPPVAPQTVAPSRPSAPTAAAPPLAPPPRRAALSRVTTQPAMWLLVLTRVTASMGTQMLRVHLVAFFVLVGYSRQSAANTLGAVGLVSLFARPLIGLATDRFGRELVFTVGMSVSAGAVLFILWLSDGSSLWPLAFYVGLSGLTDGISGLIVGAKAADLFPSQSLGPVMGFVELGRGAAIFAGPLLAGLLFDRQDDYVAAFILSAGLSFASILSMWAAHFIGRRARPQTVSTP